MYLAAQTYYGFYFGPIRPPYDVTPSCDIVREFCFLGLGN